MPTATGKETTAEREARQRSERYAAMRAVITDEMRARAAIDAAAIVDGAEPPDYPAGDVVAIRAGRQRPAPVDVGELERLALADAVKARGLAVISHRTTFGLFAGRSTLRYSLTIGR
jgi:hypothetical protein